jgi:hypothetical protein
MLSLPYTLSGSVAIFCLILTVINLIIAYYIDFYGRSNSIPAIFSLLVIAMKTTGLFQVLAIYAIPVITIVLIIQLIKFIIYKLTVKKLKK